MNTAIVSSLSLVVLTLSNWNRILQKLIHFPGELSNETYIFGKGIEFAEKWAINEILTLNNKNFHFLSHFDTYLCAKQGQFALSVPA